MATEKYEKKKESIATAAFKLFQEKGFEETSVKDIADAAGIKKALVRYYFPKKEAFEDLFLKRSMDLALQYVKELEEGQVQWQEQLYLVGYFELYYVSRHEPMLKLGKDIMADRELTRSIQHGVMQWVEEHKTLTEDEKTMLAEGIIFASGAAIENIYYHVAADEPFDMEWVYKIAIRTFESATGLTFDVSRFLCKMDEAWLSAKCREMDKEILILPLGKSGGED